MDKNKFINEYLQGKHPITGDTWELPTDSELDSDEALFDALLAERKVTKRRKLPIVLWWLTSGIAASILLLTSFSLLTKEKEPVEEKITLIHEIKSTPKQQPNMKSEPKQAKQENPVTVKSTKVKRAKPPIVQTSKEPTLANAEPQPEEDISPLPPDKQALVDIFLAEEALQVAYQLQAEQEAIRACAASLTGQKLPQNIIAF